MLARITAFLEELRATPSRVIFHSARASVSAGRFRDACLHAAEPFAKAKLPTGAVVVLAAPPGPEFQAACCAAWMHRCVVLMADDHAPAEALERLAVSFGAVAVWQAAAESSTRDVLPRPPSLRDGPATRWPEGALIRLTSGSSGAATGILVSAAQLEADVRGLAAAMRFSSADRMMATLPLSHAYGLSVVALPMLLLGSTMVLPEGRCPLLAAAAHGGTVLPSVPSWYRSLTARAEAPQVPERLRLLISAGEPLSPRVANDFADRFGRRISVLYGASECGAIAFDPEGATVDDGGVGRTLPGVTVRLCDQDPASGVGRLAVRSPAVGIRYLPDDRPEQLGGGEFVSEDRAELRTDKIYLRGREHAWLKVKGRRLDPGEVALLLEEHAGIAEACVFGRETPRGETVLCAAIVARNGPIEYRELVAWCRARMASWKLPRSVVILPALPRTARGKIDHDALRRQVESEVNS